MDTNQKTSLKIAKEVQLKTEGKEAFFCIEHAGTVFAGRIRYISRQSSTLSFTPQSIWVCGKKEWEKIAADFSWNVKISDKAGLVIMVPTENQLYEITELGRKLAIKIYDSEKKLKEYLNRVYSKKRFQA